MCAGALAPGGVRPGCGPVAFLVRLNRPSSARGCEPGDPTALEVTVLQPSVWVSLAVTSRSCSATVRCWRPRLQAPCRGGQVRTCMAGRCSTRETGGARLSTSPSVARLASAQSSGGARFLTCPRASPAERPWLRNVLTPGSAVACNLTLVARSAAEPSRAKPRVARADSAAAAQVAGSPLL